MRALCNKTYYFLLIAVSICCGFIPLGVYAQNQLFDAYNSVQNASVLKPGEDIDAKIRENFFLRVDVNKTECFVGELIMATFKAYSRLDATSEVLTRPSFSGFSVMEMVDAYSTQPDVEKFNGEFFFVHLIRKVQLFPLQAGSYTLEPAEVSSVIHLRRASAAGRPRDAQRRGHGQDSLDRSIISKTPSVTILVKPLPLEGQPPEFSGAVGDFSMELELGDSTINQYEPANVKLMINGSGNFPIVTDPPVQWPGKADVSIPKVQEDVNRYEFPLTGSKIFEYALQSPDTGRFVIPPVHLAYFDPSSASYKIAETAPVHYIVAPGEPRSARELAKGATSKKNKIPMHYFYFGILAAGIIGWIIYQATRSRSGKIT